MWTGNWLENNHIGEGRNQWQVLITGVGGVHCAESRNINGVINSDTKGPAWVGFSWLHISSVPISWLYLGGPIHCHGASGRTHTDSSHHNLEKLLTNFLYTTFSRFKICNLHWESTVKCGFDTQRKMFLCFWAGLAGIADLNASHWYVCEMVHSSNYFWIISMDSESERADLSS